MEAPSVPTTEEKTCCGCKDGCKCKKGKGLIITTIIMTVLALCGVGFGVYGMIKANEKSESDKKPINPIVSSTDEEDISFRFWTESRFAFSDKRGDNYDNTSFGITLSIMDGKVRNCYFVYSELDEESNTIKEVETDEDVECKIDGISGKIYDVAQIGYGLTADDIQIAFLLEDGTVDLLDLNKVSSKDTTLKINGKLKVDQPVTGIFHDTVYITSKEGIGGYIGQMIRLADNTLVPVSEDMIESK